jgi:hypothetical protein
MQRIRPTPNVSIAVMTPAVVLRSGVFREQSCPCPAHPVKRQPDDGYFFCNAPIRAGFPVLDATLEIVARLAPRK